MKTMVRIIFVDGRPLMSGVLVRPVISDALVTIQYQVDGIIFKAEIPSNLIKTIQYL